MKKIFKIVFILIIAFCVFNYFYLFFGAKNLIINKLKSATGRNVSVGQFWVIPPFKLQLKDLDIEGVVKVKTVYIHPSILSIFFGRLTFVELKLIEPRLTIEKIAPSAKGPESGSDNAPKEHFLLLFRRLTINNGELEFTDKTVSSEGIKIIIKDINFDITTLYSIPDSLITKFSLTGNIPWQETKDVGMVEITGWINILKKDMQAVLKISDIDAIELYPYYSTWVNLEDARIERAKLNFTSDIHGLNNEITAKCHLRLNEIVFKSRAPGEKEDKAQKMANLVLGILKSTSQDGIYLDFTFKTKMDSPQFGFDYIRAAFESRLSEAIQKNAIKTEDVVMFPAKIIEGAVKGTTDVTKALIGGAASVGTELKKSLEGAFRKEPKPEAQEK